MFLTEFFKDDERAQIERLRGTIPLETWCSILEHHLVNDSIPLLESLDQNLVDKIRNTQSLSASVSVGDECIIMPIIIINNTLQIYDTQGNYPAKSQVEFSLVTAKDGQVITVKFNDGTVSTFPNERLSKLTYMTVILSKSKQDYNKLLTWVKSISDTDLPPVATLAESKLMESATAEIYHYANTSLAAKIMRDGMFKLSNTTGNQSEEKYALPGYPYFLSTTRSKVGDYHRYAGSSACMFVLDGNWFNQHYKSRPIDYWDRSWNYPDSPRTRESEDRIYSKSPSIPLNGVKAVHVYIQEQSEYRSPEVRGILIQAKKMGIQAYLYTDETAWRLQNIRRAVTPGQAAAVLKGPQQPGYSRQPYDAVEPWLELIMKKNKAELSPKAEKLRYNLVYYGSRYENEDSGLSNDMANSRKPDSGGYDIAVKITDYMRRNRIPDLLTLKNMLVKKWDNIK